VARVSYLVSVLFTALVVAATGALAEPVLALGRCPLENVVAASTGRFLSRDSEEILVVQDLGRLELARGPGRDKTLVHLRRLALLCPGVAGFRTVWLSEPFNTTNVVGSDIAGTCWTTGDIDADGRHELLLFTADTVRVLSFDADTFLAYAYGLDGVWVEAAACCDPDGDGLTEVALLQLAQTDSGGPSRVLKLYRMTAAGLAPCAPCSAAVECGTEAKVALLGAARLEDYSGELPILASIYPTPRPSLYQILYRPKSDSLVLTDKPFPWQEWFSKTRVLPAGELTFFNVGDTLAACGYFVPGSRPSGPSLSFAALDDGEWRLLPLLEPARRVSGPVCRFTWQGRRGWLELRDNLFYFYPGEIFRWR